jgi:hypothetical protein
VQQVIVASVLGVLLGWPVAGVAFAPYVLYVLLSPRLSRSFCVLFATAIPVLGALVLCDIHFYGKPTVQLYRSKAFFFVFACAVQCCSVGQSAAERMLQHALSC